MLALGYELYLLVLTTTLYSLAALARKIFLLPLENKIHNFNATPNKILSVNLCLSRGTIIRAD